VRIGVLTHRRHDALRIRARRERRHLDERGVEGVRRHGGGLASAHVRAREHAIHLHVERPERLHDLLEPGAPFVGERPFGIAAVHAGLGRDRMAQNVELHARSIARDF
jgi:hypothetical protein